MAAQSLWPIHRLGDDVEIKGRIGWRGYKKSDLRTNGPVVLGGNNVKSHIFLELTNVKHISREKFDESPDIKLKKGDVILVTRGNLADCAYFDGAIPEATINPSLVILSEFAGDSRFLFYYFKSFKGRKNLLSISSGSSVPAIYQSQIKELQYPHPPFQVQRTIAHVLGALDDKIELNRRMNRTLEETAQTLFKSWFIDFDGHDDFVDSELGPIPRGWEVKPLDQIATYLNGAACQKYPAKDGEDRLPVIKIRELKHGITPNTDMANVAVPAKFIVNDGDVLFSWSGSLRVKVWTGGKGFLNQHLFKVTSADYPKWFYYFWTFHYMKEFQRIAEDKTTTMGHIKRQHLSESLVVVPPAQVITDMDNSFRPLIEQGISRELESRTLASLRDTLLPKLISGKLRVPEAERMMEAAA